MDSTTKKRYLTNWLEERNAIVLYQALSKAEKDPKISEIYLRISEVEVRHAALWEELLKKEGENVPQFNPGWRTRIYVWMVQRFGPASVLNNIQKMESNGSESYANQPEAFDLVGEERSHAILISQISSGISGGVPGGTLAKLEGRHRTSGGNALRAAVLGANDGLVSNLSLVMGVAGAALSNRSILITGFAGLLAGACSMALGEWLSVQSSRELFSHQIGIEKEEVEQNPEEESEELALIYEARGLDKEEAQRLASKIMENKEQALDTLAREELGIDPEELGGSAWEAALTSFFLFALGAIIPVIPYMFLTGMTAVIVSISFSVVGLFILGAIITVFTGKPLVFSGFRMVIFGLIAAAVTFGIGRLIGASLA